MNWFKRSSAKTSFPWKELTSEDQLLEIIENKKQYAIFKHSTRCSISSTAKSRLESEWDLDENTPIYYLDLIQFRSVSNLIEEKLNVMHQSPQLILVKDGKVVYQATHNGIRAEAAKKVLISL